MIIKKLNTMFYKHGRVLFAVFTFVIIITFLDFLTPGRGGCGEGGAWGTPGVGTAFGKKVTIDDLRDLSQQQQVINMIFYGGSGRDVRPEELFQEYCLLEKAAQLGVTASSKEVAQWLAALPLFQQDGKFSETKYREAMASFKKQGISEALLNQSVRTIVILSKLQQEVTSGVIVTDSEITETYRQMGTKYLVGVKQFAAKDYAAKVPAQDAEALRRFFDENRALYTVEGKFTALAAEIPSAAFAEAARKLATPEALKAYFEANASRFADKDGKVPEYPAVAAKVAAAFISERSMELALNRAYDFSSRVYDEIANAAADKRGGIFRAAADKEKITVIEAKDVLLGAAQLPGVDGAPALVSQLLAVTTANPLTNAVRGAKAAYVGILISRVETRPAEYDEVAAKVATDCRDRAASRLALEAAEKEYASLNAVSDPAKRAGAFAALKPTTFAFSPKEFKVPNGMETAVSIALQLRSGQIAQPLPEPDGSAMLVSLLKTVPPDMSGLDADREMIRARLLYSKRSLKWTGFIEDLSAECALTMGADQQQQ